jgi:hypothetical protein
MTAAARDSGSASAGQELRRTGARSVFVGYRPGPLNEPVVRDDGVTIVTEDSAHAAHTVAITATGPQILVTAG